jgi:hypothetical protein
MIKPCEFEKCIHYKNAQCILSSGKQTQYMVSPCLMCIFMKRTNQFKLNLEEEE